jgi:ADP-ribose pyrophosphatase
MTAPEITTLATRIAYANKWMSVREDKVRFADGHESIYGVVDKPDFVLVIPIHADGKIQLVEQFRYPVGRRFWELPQGGWPPERGAAPVEVAHGELAEETGLRAGSMDLLGHFHQACGLINQGYHAFVATDLSPGPVNREVEEQGMISDAFGLDDIIAMIGAGQIKDASTIAALGYLRLLGRL